ncbi:MAG: lysine-2,3-aminomutase-like protein [Alphaproteobacteria bacterium]|nr:lysine-2,3-aminomutase-like protein [Alphaproteobacteria bacterium]
MPLQTLKSVSDLVSAGLVSTTRADVLKDVVARYAVAVPAPFQALIDVEDPTDPLARQFVPSAEELSIQPDEHADPIGDTAHTPVKGVVHRYRDRALLKIVNVCPVYCRFCFRREMVGPGQPNILNDAELCDAVAYLRSQPGITEIILTGGDPLVLSPRRVRQLTEVLSEIPHVQRLRWHTRMPVAQPDRITTELVAALTPTEKQVRAAVHINHARELSSRARSACRRLATAGINLLSQSVLLRGVNDTPDALAVLAAAFQTADIAPYYLHHLDLAPGTGHFRVPIRDGHALLAAVQQRHPDLALPTYILDIPGGAGKVPITAAHVRFIGRDPLGDLYRVRDPLNHVHIYRDPARR